VIAAPNYEEMSDLQLARAQAPSSVHEFAKASMQISGSTRHAVNSIITVHFAHFNTSAIIASLFCDDSHGSLIQEHR